MSSTTPNVGDTVTFDASGSSVGSGRTITGYSWNFGDGTSGSGKTTSHAFRDPGTFAVSLTITDDLGRVATASQVLTAKSNAPTTVDFVFSPTDPLTGELVVFNGSLSSAASGRTIRSYSWDFGDGNTGSGVTAQHAFKTDRTYTVVLTVTDDLGQTGSKSKTVKVSSLTAVFTVTPTNPAVGETVKVSATGGANSTYAWDFGNGRSATTQSATTTYTAVGTYTIVLTLTDSLGNVATASASVTVK
jgi:PKD repeat protein